MRRGLPNDSGALPSQRADVINLSLGASGTLRRHSWPTCSRRCARRASPSSLPPETTARTRRTHRPPVPASSAWRPSGHCAPGRRTRISAHRSTWPRPAATRPATSTATGLQDGVYSTHASGGGSSTSPTLRCSSQGTSMAAPHVSGVIALMLSRNAAVTPAQIDSAARAGRAHGRHRPCRTRRSRDRAHQRAQCRRGRRPAAATGPADPERDALLARLRRHRRRWRRCSSTNAGGGDARHRPGFSAVRAVALGQPDVRRRQRPWPFTR